MFGNRKLNLNIPYAERLIYYFLIPDVIARIVYEIGSRIPPLEINQQKQYIFYTLIAIDLAFWLVRFGRARLSLSRIHPMAAVTVVMIVQGVFIGLTWGNLPFRVFVDTANVAVVLINLLRFTDPAAFRGFTFSRVVKYNNFYCFAMLPLSVVAVAVNSQSSITLGGAVATSVSLGVIFARIMAPKDKKIFGKYQLAIDIAIILAVIPSWNRTTLIVFLFVIIFSQYKVLIRYFYIGLLSIFVAGAVAGIGLTVLPADSRLGQRISGLQSLNLTERSGSIGERQAEADAVNYKIDRMGPKAKVFGAGHGATYDVKYTWIWKRDYSNVHYSWSLFKLRYGAIGWIFLGLWALALLVSAINNFRSRHPIFIFVGILSLWGLLYLSTYSYFTFFIAGYTFMRPFTGGLGGRPMGAVLTPWRRRPGGLGGLVGAETVPPVGGVSPYRVAEQEHRQGTPDLS